MFKLRKDLQWLFLEYNECALHCYILYPKSFRHATAPLSEGVPVSSVQLCVLWDCLGELCSCTGGITEWNPRLGQRRMLCRSFLQCTAARGLFPSSLRFFWGVGLMFYAEVLKYEIDSLGSCKGWRHCEKEAAYLYWEEFYPVWIWARQVFAQMGLGDKERQ